MIQDMTRITDILFFPPHGQDSMSKNVRDTNKKIRKMCLCFLVYGKWSLYVFVNIKGKDTVVVRSVLFPVQDMVT